MMKKIYLCLLFTLILGLKNSFAQTLQLEDNWWVAYNGAVNSLAKDTINNIIYLGGNFTYVGPPEAYGTALNQSTLSTITSFSNPNGEVKVTIPDGNGGWYIGGTFSTVGDSNRFNIAHINNNGTVSAFNPNINGTIWALKLFNGILYIGGDFSLVGATMRNNIAAIDVSTGQLTTWNPNINSIVYAIDATSTEIFVGGNFNDIGGVTRNKIGGIDLTTGIATAFNPNANNIVYSIFADGNTIYAGGNFTTIGSLTRNRLSSIDYASSIATSWNPNVNGTVRSILKFGNSLYFGGDFSTVFSTTRNRIAACNYTTGTLSLFNPNANNAVYTISTLGNKLLMGGSFTSVNATLRNYVAEIDTATSLTTTNVIHANNTIFSIATNSTQIYAGGSFTSIGGILRNRIAAIDGNTGMATTWNPNCNQNVNILAVNGTKVYVGGNFSSIGGQSRNFVAAIDAATGIATSWNPNPNNIVYSFAFKNNKVYTGGNFTFIGGQSRTYIAEIDSTTGNASAWNPVLTGSVNCLLLKDSSLFLGGNFSSIDAISRGYCASFNINTGLLNTFNGKLNNIVRSMTFVDTTLFVGGDFTSYNSVTVRNRLASFNIIQNTLNSWNPNANNIIYSVKYSNNNIYIGGSFTTLNGVSKGYLAAIPAFGNGTMTSWNPQANNVVASIITHVDRLYAGGSFNTITNKPRNSFAVFSPCASTLSPTATSPQLFCNSATVNNLVASGSSLAWYSTPTGGNPLSNSTPILVDTNTYYVSQTINGCESFQRLPVQVILNVTPVPTFNNPIQLCAGSTFANIPVNGQNVKYYTSVASMTPIPMTNTITNTGYFATQTINGCESQKIYFSLSLINTPIPTGSSSYSFCYGSTLANIPLTGTNIIWYDSITGGNVLPDTTTLLNNTLYYASQTLNGCESQNRKSVQVYITMSNPPVATSPQALCNYSTVANIIAIGSSLKWYDSLIGGTQYLTSTTLQQGATYYVSQTIGTCTSARTAVTVALDSVATPTGDTIQNFCRNDLPTIASLVINTTNPKWYQSQTSTTNYNPSTLLSNNTYYFGVYTVGNCESYPRLKVLVNILPNVGMNKVDNIFTAIETNAIYQWVDCNNNFAPLPGEVNQTFTATANGRYAVIVTKNGCTDTSICRLISNVAVQNVNSVDKIQIHPNPNSGRFILDVPIESTLIFTDAIGNILSSKKLSLGKNNIDFSAYADGIYFIKINMLGNQNVTKKIIIQR